MRRRYLEITFRKGRPLAAYLYLPREAGDRSHRTESASEGLVVDYSEDGRAIGIEITTPGRVHKKTIDDLLRNLGMAPLDQADLAPLEAA